MIDDRINKIIDCVEQINESMKRQSPGDFSTLLWELDQRTELHRLLYENEID